MSARSATRLRGVPCESQASGAVPTMVAMTPLPATRRHGTPRESNSAHTASAVHASWPLSWDVGGNAAACRRCAVLCARRSRGSARLSGHRNRTLRHALPTEKNPLGSMVVRSEKMPSCVFLPSITSILADGRREAAKPPAQGGKAARPPAQGAAGAAASLRAGHFGRTRPYFSPTLSASRASSRYSMTGCGPKSCTSDRCQHSVAGMPSMASARNTGSLPALRCAV